MVELAAAGTHLAGIGSHLLFVQIAGLQRIGEFGQSFGGAQQLLGHIGNKRVTHLSETNHVTDIGNQHDNELLVDTPHSHLQPVGAVDGLRGDVIALVLGHDVPLRSIGGQVELALASGLARLVNGIQHLLLGNGVIRHHTQAVGGGIAADHLVVLVDHHGRTRQHGQQRGSVVGQIVIIVIIGQRRFHVHSMCRKSHDERDDSHHK